MSQLDRYRTHADLPKTLKVFPLPGALLLPRSELPLNIFEPRYLALVNDALAGDRLIGMIQPEQENSDLSGNPPLFKIGCAGRITSYAETPDDRILINLTGVSRFAIEEELGVKSPYRQVRASFAPFTDDLVPGHREDEVDRPQLLAVFRAYLDANDLSTDWKEVERASTEALVNTLSVLAPYESRDKQALLEAASLKARADVLVALTEMNLARSGGRPHPRLQ
jgi:Lon protease-like protein